MSHEGLRKGVKSAVSHLIVGLLHASLSLLLVLIITSAVFEGVSWDADKLSTSTVILLLGLVVIGAMFALWGGAKVHKEDGVGTRSRFYLQKCREGLANISAALDRETLRRTDLDAVVKMLHILQRLRKFVTELQHKDVLALQEERCRSLIRRNLQLTPLPYLIGVEPDVATASMDYKAIAEVVQELLEDGDESDDGHAGYKTPGRTQFSRSGLTMEHLCELLGFLVDAAPLDIKASLVRGDGGLLNGFRSDYPATMACLYCLWNAERMLSE